MKGAAAMFTCLRSLFYDWDSPYNEILYIKNNKSIVYGWELL